VTGRTVSVRNRRTNKQIDGQTDRRTAMACHSVSATVLLVLFASLDDGKKSSLYN